MAKLDIQYTDGHESALSLESGTQWLIGRDPSCEICLDDTVTSRRHARLYRDEHGQYWIQDLQSKNGTQVNSRQVSTARVRSGDLIAIGACTLSFTVSEASSIVLGDAGADPSTAAASAWGPGQRVDLARQRLQTLYELNERLTGRLDRDDLLTEVLSICLESLRFERAGIAVWAGHPHPPQWVRIEKAGGNDSEEIHISRSLVDRVLRNGERILISDTSGGGFDPTASMIAGHIRSAMCVPMEYLGQVRGVIYGDRVSSAGGYNKEDTDFFAALGRLGAMGLANAQLVEEMRERQKVEMQLEWARQIQAQLLPGELLSVPGLKIDALNDPGQKVSGDYYDYFVRPDGLVTVVVADVAGKGAPAALLMANLQAAVHVLLREERDLPRAVGLINDLVCSNIRDSRFITALIGLLDPVERSFSYVNAGHMGPYRIHRGGVDKLNPEPNLPLGLEPANRYCTERIDLAGEAATLFMYTDGVPDAENPQGDRFGEDRLAELLRGIGDLGPAELIARVRRSIKQFVRNHPQTDDITLLVMCTGD